MEPYVLLPQARRTGVVDGANFHTLRRTRWKVSLRVLSLASGGSVSVVLEGSPDADSDSAYRTLHDFGAVSAAGTTVVYSYTPPADSGATTFSMTDVDLEIRGRITAATGEHVVEFLAESRLVDLEDAAIVEELPAILRAAETTRQRYVDEAERDIIRHLQFGAENSRGVIPVRSDDPQAWPILRRAIIMQAEWRSDTERLFNSGNRDDQKDARRRPSISPGAEDVLEAILIRPRGWRGR